MEEYINYRGIFLKKEKEQENTDEAVEKFLFYRYNAGSFQDPPIIFHDNIEYERYEDSWLIDLIEKTV